MTTENTDDELIPAIGETRRNFMECFIIENGVERRADLEDLFPLIIDRDGEGAMLQFFLRKVNRSKIYIASALAHLPEEMKETIYRNMSVRNRKILKQQVNDLERYKKDDYFLQTARRDFIDFLGELEKDRLGWYNFLPENVIWKENKPKEGEKRSPLESFIKHIERAVLDSGALEMSYYDDKTTQDDIRNAFQECKNDLQKIRSLSINGRDLPAAALLFEMGKIEELCIYDVIDGEWPSFMENCHALTKLEIINYKLSECPSWMRNASSLRYLAMSYSEIASLPDWIGDFHSLTTLSLQSFMKLEVLPESIGNLKNLDELYIGSSCIKKLPDSISNLKNLQTLSFRYLDIEKIPDWIGDLQSLTELSLDGNKKLKTLPGSIGNLKNLIKLDISDLPIEKIPDSIGNLKNLQTLHLDGTSIKKLPDWIGDLQSLTVLKLNNNDKLKSLPDSIGNLKNLDHFNISYTPIEELPCTIVNCTALKSVDIFGTKISAVPDFLKTIDDFNDNTAIETFPPEHSISYRCFCNSYYKLAETILFYNDKARREGLLALEDELEYFADGFVKMGIRLVVDGTDAGYIRNILRIKSEHEHDFYRKKLMEIATEGILCIQAGDSPMFLAFLLASLVNIKNNPLDAACAKYCAGDTGALDNIDFSAAIQPEEEREEVCLIKRAIELSETARREGILALEEHLDHKGIAARDILEYGLVPVIDGWDFADTAKILDNLIAHETDPVRINIAQAKKAAVKAISEGENPRLLFETLCAFFDESIAGEIHKNYD